MVAVSDESGSADSQLHWSRFAGGGQVVSVGV